MPGRLASAIHIAGTPGTTVMWWSEIVVIVDCGSKRSTSTTDDPVANVRPSTTVRP